jgi:hypothetical protein
MFSKLPFLLTILSVLVATARASPLAPRQTACPTISRWQETYYSPTYLTTSPQVIFYSTLVNVTSTYTHTQTEERGYPVTVISPDVLTIPSRLPTPVLLFHAPTCAMFCSRSTNTDSIPVHSCHLNHHCRVGYYTCGLHDRLHDYYVPRICAY